MAEKPFNPGEKPHACGEPCANPDFPNCHHADHRHFGGVCHGNANGGDPMCKCTQFVSPSRERLKTLSPGDQGYVAVLHSFRNNPTSATGVNLICSGNRVMGFTISVDFKEGIDEVQWVKENLPTHSSSWLITLLESMEKAREKKPAEV